MSASLAPPVGEPTFIEDVTEQLKMLPGQLQRDLNLVAMLDRRVKSRGDVGGSCV